MARLIWLFVGGIAGSALYAAAPVHLAWDPPAAATMAAHHALRAPGRAPLPDFTDLVEQVGPSVVNVTTRSRPLELPDIAERHFDVYRGLTGQLEMPRQSGVGIGSGFILGQDGYVLTNAHVVEGADEVFVRLTGGKRELRAKVIGTDRATDIALLKIGASHLPVARTGSSEALKVGDWVAAIGSPFGFDNTITARIISAKERRLPHSAEMPFLQSDVAINPGSSGGPLVNLKGEVVGVNSKIYTRSGGYMGVSFAIPIETALKVSGELRKRGLVARGFLGLETQTVNEVLGASFGLQSARGALVTRVQRGSPAGRAGVQVGDIVLAYAGTSVARADDFARAVENTPPGTRVALTLWRRTGEVMTAAVLDLAGKDERRDVAPPRKLEADTLELVLSAAPLEQCHSLNIDYGLVVHPFGGSAALGLEPGDVIVAVNEQRFRTRHEFDRLLAERKQNVAPVALLVVRAGRSRYVPFDYGSV